MYAVGHVFLALNDRTDTFAGERIEEVADVLLTEAFGDDAHASDEAWGSDEVRVHTYTRSEEIATELYEAMMRDEWAPSNVPDLELGEHVAYHHECARIYRKEGTVDLGHVELPSPPRTKGRAELVGRLESLTTRLNGIRATLDARQNATEATA
jgi:hypothetical protein